MTLKIKHKTKRKMKLKSLYSNPLIRFIARRVVFLILTFIIFLVLIFTLPRAIPGSPINNILAQLSRSGMDPSILRLTERQLMEELGLNKTIEDQFFNFISGLLRGDLGKGHFK